MISYFNLLQLFSCDLFFCDIFAKCREYKNSWEMLLAKKILSLVKRAIILQFLLFVIYCTLLLFYFYVLWDSIYILFHNSICCISFFADMFCLIRLSEHTYNISQNWKKSRCYISSFFLLSPKGRNSPKKYYTWDPGWYQSGLHESSEDFGCSYCQEVPHPICPCLYYTYIFTSIPLFKN